LTAESSRPAPDTEQPAGRLLITGVPGWLTDAFLTRLADDPLPGISAVRALALPGQAKSCAYKMDLEWVEADLRDAAAVQAAARGVDTVLHTAGVLHVRRIRDFYDVNTAGTIALARAVRAAGGRRFAFVSTNAAAGRSDGAGRLLTEAEAPRPLNDYGASKLKAERALLALDGLEVVNLRPCMFYGPPVPPRHVDIYRRILKGTMPLVGSGEYVRSTIFIDSLVDACRLALTHPKAVGQTYFIADRKPYTTKRILEAMAKALGAEPRFIPAPALVAPIAFAVDGAISKLGLYWQTVHLLGEADWNVGCSVEKAVQELGFDPRITLEEGMQRAVDWCRERGLLD
jgi:nucleoside-diphosphate-sugar epimerase